MNRLTPLLLAGLFCASAALAHTGVQNATVKAWMDGMEDLAADTKRLGQMAKGVSPFDADAAERALANIKAHADRIPDLFNTPADDPKSEARESIWSNWDRFVEISSDLSRTAATAEISDVQKLQETLSRIGATCKSCHSDFRD